jgi:MFS family permease
MSSIARRVARPRFHYAWVVVGVTFLALLASAGVRAAPGALIVPLERAIGWDRASISLVVAISILTYGLGAPLGSAIVDRVGIRLVMAGGLGVIAAGSAAMMLMTELWQFLLLWGVIIGLATGAVASVLGATIAIRWFRTDRGMVVGLFSAAASMGQLLFLPTLVSLTVVGGWEAAVAAMAVAVGALVVPALLLMREGPSDVGLRAYGDTGDPEPAEAGGVAAQDVRVPMATAARSVDFWLLAGSFFVCGFTSNGLIGTHLLPHAVEHGFSEVTAAGAVGVMGLMNVVGTLASGWLTDRYDNRRLLAAYYGFRAASIFALPFVADTFGLYAFAIVYGLDWIATVPPTANLVARIWGRASVGSIYGWVYFSHMVGAAIAAFAGGVVRQTFGDYSAIFLAAALLGFVAAGMATRISHPGVATSSDEVAAAAA